MKKTRKKKVKTGGLTKVMRVRCSPDEKRNATKLADALGITVSELLRQVIAKAIDRAK